MTWFRCGGSGIPASLKNRMNAVFNKKFGTAVDYPAEGWPDDVNLMGPLPEKTIVSSPIADFSDGADDVPTKSLVVTIPPTLSGVSSVNGYKGGANFIELYTRSNHNGIDYSINADGSLHRDGTASGNSFNNANATNYSNCPFKFKAGTYTLSVSGSSDASSFTSLGIFLASGASFTSQGVTGNGTKTFTVSEDFGAWYYIKTNNGVQVNDNVYIWISAGSTAHAYEPYQTPTQYTANLGRPIYGGQVDIVNGVGESLCGKIVFDGSETRWAEYATGNGYAIPLTGMKRGTWYTSPLALSSPLPKAPNNDNLGVRIGANNDGIYVVQANTIEGVTDLASFKAWLSENPLTIIYPLDVTEDFTFTGQEVPTRLGYNAFWSDQGDTEVTYRADISLALQAASGSRGLMMASRPAIEPSNGDQGSEESTENNIETEGDENAR